MRPGGLARRVVGAALAGMAGMAGMACSHPAETSTGGPAPSTSVAPDRLAPLHAFEEERRRSVDFARLPPSDHALGADPIAIRAVPGASPARFVGLLRGRDALVLLDASLHELARAPAPAFPTGLAVAEDGEILVSGEQSTQLVSYWIERDTLRRATGPDLAPYASGLCDAALGRARRGRVGYAVDARAGFLTFTSLQELQILEMASL